LDKKTQAELAEDLEKGQTEEQFKVLDRAMPPGSPYKPNRQQFFGLAFILGLGFGGMLGLLRDHMDRSFHKAEDVERLLGFPVIATLPRIKAGRATRS
jgi:uncharacterized protein involved in exopolysaccharide biosynthesis